MKHFLHFDKLSVNKALIVFIGLLLTPLAAIAQTGFWTDEGNYDKDWPTAEDIDGDYYNIRNEADLAAFANMVNTGKDTFKGKIVRVYNTHIDLKEHYWIPIGSDTRKFEGTFDGMEHRFENMVIDIDKLSDEVKRYGLELGFFGDNYGTIRNVSLQSPQIRGTEIYNDLHVGGISVYNRGGAMIENCIVFDDEEKLTGEQPSLIDVTYCEGYHSNHVEYIGAICGMNEANAMIQNCRNDKPIRMEYASIAGIVSMNEGIVKNCSNSRELRSVGFGSYSVSGVTLDNRGEVMDCVNSGTLYGDYGNVAGIINNNTGMCSGCRNTGTIESRRSGAVGICSSNNGGTCVRNTNIGHIMGIDAAGIVWDNCSGKLTDCDNSGSVDGFSAAAGIVGVNGFYSVPGQKRQIPSKPIENCENTGKITVKNDGTNSTYNGAKAGGICASGDSIINCQNKGEVTVFAISYGYAGGIVGYQSRDGIISYCYNTASISVSGGGEANPSWNKFGAGGIVGFNSTNGGGMATITNCFNTGDISCVNKDIADNGSTCRTGGLVGGAAIISNSYNTGNVSSQSEKAAVSLAYGIGGSSVEYGYSTGNVNAYGSLESGSSYQLYKTEAYGIGGKASNCLALSKSVVSTNIAFKVGVNKTEQGNYASTLLKLETKDGDCSSLEGIDANGDHGRFWKPDMIAPIDTWPADAWDKSDNTILPRLKYADGTLMPDQPRLLKADYAEKVPSVSVGDTILVEPLKYKVLSATTVSVLGPDVAEGSGTQGNDNDSWPVTQCEIPATISYQGGDFAVKAIEDEAFSGAINLAGLTIPEGVKTIGREAFYRAGLQALHIPSSVTLIKADEDEALFAKMDDCERITVEEGNPSYSTRDNILYDKAKTEVLWAARPDTALILPSGVSSIRTRAFEYQEGITSIIFPKGLESIGTSAFEGNSGLRTIRFMNTEAVPTIGEDAFYGTKLEQITVYVPKGTKAMYEAIALFPNIVEEAAGEVSVKIAFNAFDTQYIAVGETVVSSISPIYLDFSSLEQDYRIILEMENADKLSGDYGAGSFGEMKPLTFADGKATILKSECRIDTEGGKMRVIPYLDIIAKEAGDYPYTIKVYDESGTTCYAEFSSVFKAVEPVSFAVVETIEGNIQAGIPFNIQIASAGMFSGKEAVLRVFTNYHADDSLAISYGEVKVPFVKENEEYMNTGLDLALVDQTYSFTLTGKKATVSDLAYISFGLYHENRTIPIVGRTHANLSLSSSLVIEEAGSEVEDEVLDEITIADNPAGSSDTLDVKLSGVTTRKLTVATEVITKLDLSGTNNLGEVINNGTLIFKTTIDTEVALTYKNIVNHGIFVDSTGLVNEVEGTAALTIQGIRQQVGVGSTIALTATAIPGEDYVSVIFIWQMFVNGEWITLDTNQKVVSKAASFLRAIKPLTDTYTVNAEDAGLYRCVVTNKASEGISTTLVSTTEVRAASIPDLDPTPEPDLDPENPTSVEQSETDSLKVWSSGNHLYIHTPKPETVYIVTFSGRLHKVLPLSVGEYVENMPQGTYIIHIGKQSYKLRF